MDLYNCQGHRLYLTAKERKAFLTATYFQVGYGPERFDVLALVAIICRSPPAVALAYPSGTMTSRKCDEVTGLIAR